MKRILKLTGAVLAFALAISLTGCGNASDDSDTYSSDTVITLSAPKVTAKAYPGVNIIAWQGVKDAQYYAVRRRDEAGLEKTLTSRATSLVWYDSDVLVNKAKYTYTVIAFNASNGLNPSTSRTAVVRDSSTEVTLSAITAPVSTAALALAAYENGWDGTTAPTFTDASANTLSSDTVTVTANGQYIVVQFPGKAYLDYTVTDYYGNVLEDSDVTLTGTASLVNNALRTYYFIPAAGDHTFNIVASPKNTAYYTESDAVAKTATTTASLATWNASVSAVWAGSSAKVSFTPKAGYTDASAYTVYRYAEGTYTALTGTISASTDGSQFVILDDGASKAASETVYYVVLTDGTDSVASSSIASLTGSLGAWELDVDWTDDITAVVNADASAVYVSWKGATDYKKDDHVSMYTVYRALDDDADDVVDSDEEFELLGTCAGRNASGSRFWYLDETVKAGKQYFYKVVLTDSGKTAESGVSDPVALDKVYATDTASLSVTSLQLDADNQTNDVLLAFTTTSDIADSAITVLQATRNGDNAQDSAYVDITSSVTWATKYQSTSAAVAADTEKVTRIAYLKDFADGTYIFRVQVSGSGVSTKESNIDSVTISETAVASDSFAVTVAKTWSTANTESNSLSVIVTDAVDEDSETFANYSYAVSYATLTESADGNSYEVGDWSTAKTVTMTNITAVGVYQGVAYYSALDDGIYLFRVAKTDSVTGTTVYIYKQRTIVTTSTSVDEIDTTYLTSSCTATSAGKIQYVLNYAPFFYDRGTGTTSSDYYLSDDPALLKDYTWTVYRATSQYYNQIESYAKVGTISDFVGVPTALSADSTKSVVTSYTGTWTDTATTSDKVYEYSYFAVGTKTGADPVYADTRSYYVGK